MQPLEGSVKTHSCPVQPNLSPHISLQAPLVKRFPFASPGAFSSLPTTRTQQLFQHPGLQLPTLHPTDATLTPAWCKVLGPTASTVGVWDEGQLRAPSSRSVMPVAEPAEVSGAVGINS